MSYRIEYHPDTNHKFPTHQVRRRWNVLSIIVVIALLFVLGGVIKKNELVRTLLFPGDPEITQAALSEMLDEIRAGEPVKDAVTTFCVEIIDHAQGNQ